MSKHTEGPWEYGNGAVWADCNGEGNSPTEVCSFVSEQDGRLIAAAPDLLEALEALVASSEARDQARAAIAKARGE